MSRKKKRTPEEVEAEIVRLSGSADVALARKEQSILYRREKYMYQLRWMERRGQALREAGVTEDNIGEWMATGCFLPNAEPEPGIPDE